MSKSQEGLETLPWRPIVSGRSFRTLTWATWSLHLHLACIFDNDIGELPLISVGS